MPDPLEFTPRVIELLTAIVAAGGEARAADLAETCGLTRHQVRRQLEWMEGQNIINQVSADEFRRTQVRATALGRRALTLSQRA